MRRLPLLVGSLVAVLLLVSGHRPAAAGAPGGPIDWSAFAAEDAAARLAPYLLPPDAAPAGYRIGGVDVDTPATQALKEAGPEADAFVALERIQRTFVVQLHQTLTPVDGQGPPVFFTVILAVDPAAARALTEHPPAAVFTQLPLDRPLGEAAGAFRWTAAPPGRPGPEVTDVIWQRGLLAFSMQRTGEPGAGRLDDLVALAAVADAHAAARLPLNLAPRVVPPATEAERLAALLEFPPPAVRPGPLPAGFAPLSPAGPIPPAQRIVNLPPVVDREAMLRRFDESWQRVIEIGGWLARGEGDTATRLWYGLAVDRDEAAAERDLADPAATLAGAAFPSTEPSPPPITLGDGTAFWVFPSAGPPGGPAGEGLALRWRHGATLLHVESVGPPGSVTVGDLAAFAQGFEAVYQARGAAAPLGPALLQPDDLPPGWQPLTRPGNSWWQDLPVCDGAESTLAGVTGGALGERTAAVEFLVLNQSQPPYLYRSVQHAVIALPAGTGPAAMAILRDVLRDCDIAAPEPEGSVFNVQYRSAGTRALGDEAFAVRYAVFDTLDGQPAPVAGDGLLVVIRRGDALSLLSHLDVAPPPAGRDTELTDRLTRFTDERLAALTAAAPDGQEP